MSSQLSAGTMAIPPDPMTAAGATTDSPRAPGTPEAPPRTFWRRALGDAFRRPGARAGAVWVAVLAFCGVFAPFLANSHPLLLKMDGQWVFPLFRHLTPADVVLLLATLGAAALAFARGLTFPQRAALFLYVVVVLLVATATPWIVESIRDLQETAVGRFGRILGRAVAFFAGAVAALAVLVPLALWALKMGVPPRAKWAYVGAALFVGAVLV